jgi:hypothetical protein
MNAKIQRKIIRSQIIITRNYICSLVSRIIFFILSLQQIIFLMLKSTNYFTDEGHYMDFDDLVTYFRWKIYDLSSEGHSNEFITNYLNNEIWQSLAEQILIIPTLNKPTL